MDEKKKKELIKSAMVKAARTGDVVEMGRLIGDVYDVELPIPEVISSIFRVVRATAGEHVYYMSPEDVTKKVLTLTSDCNVTQEKLTPSTQTEVSWTDLISPEQYICIHDWLKADHDVLKLHADAIGEAMNRREIYGAIQLLSTASTAESNNYTLDTGKTKFDYPKLVEMARSVAKYGRRLVLVTGANVTTDLQLLNYDADKNQAVNIMDIVSQHIPVEELSVTISGTPTTVLSANDAYLVAVSDARGNEPGIFVRRQIPTDVTAMDDTEAVAKERIVLKGGNLMNVGANRKFSQSVVGFEEYANVVLNTKVVAKFTRS